MVISSSRLKEGVGEQGGVQMKRWIVVAVMVLVIATSVITAVGDGSVGGGGGVENPPAYLPIGSVHELASYAKSRVAIATGYGGSWGPLVPGGTT